MWLNSRKTGRRTRYVSQQCQVEVAFRLWRTVTVSVAQSQLNRLRHDRKYFIVDLWAGLRDTGIELVRRALVARNDETFFFRFDADGHLQTARDLLVDGDADLAGEIEKCSRRRAEPVLILSEGGSQDAEDSMWSEQPTWSVASSNVVRWTVY